MGIWKPDPSFYPSPRLASQAPPEKLAYVAAFDPDRTRPDEIAVVDVDPASPAYSRIVGNLSMPHTGDELHHFGWNACCSCLCPNAPHPHTERRYLVVPGLRSSRIYILDTKPDPLKPDDRQGDRAGDDCEPHRLHASAHGALRARRHLCDCARKRRRWRSRRDFPAGSEELRAARTLGSRPRTAAVGLRRLVASGL